MRTLVSMTTRSGVIASQQFHQPFVGERACGGFSDDLVPEIKERPQVTRSEPLVVRHRQDDSDVPVLASNDDRLPLRGVEDGAEPTFGACLGNTLHAPSQYQLIL